MVRLKKEVVNKIPKRLHETNTKRRRSRVNMAGLKTNGKSRSVQL